MLRALDAELDAALRGDARGESPNPRRRVHLRCQSQAGPRRAARWSLNFRRLDLGCMDSYGSEKRRIFGISRDLQDLNSFAPRRPEKLTNVRREFC